MQSLDYDAMLKHVIHMQELQGDRRCGLWPICEGGSWRNRVGAQVSAGE